MTRPIDNSGMASGDEALDTTAAADQELYDALPREIRDVLQDLPSKMAAADAAAALADGFSIEEAIAALREAA